MVISTLSTWRILPHSKNGSSFSTYAPPMIKISPVLSLVMNKRSLLSHARPVGRKHPLGQLFRLEFCMMLTAAVVLVDSSTGCPFLKAIFERRYPSGGLRSLRWVSRLWRECERGTLGD